ncbi:MAG: carboxypeptidase-like regulatory domain-containing protein, partial [candidate division Zixibacteria bacterium]|nr:carboxypeptidase-like regulatory domain-containing protein [candidate division Zixibacteria bacterium]
MHLVRKLLSAAIFGIWATILVPAISVSTEEPKALPPSEKPSPAALAQISSLENSHYGAIQGKLSDAHTGEALIGATVRLEGTPFGGATDLDGKFQIREVPEGKYVLTASYMGYSKSTLDNLKVSSGQVTNTSLSLKQEAIAMDEVVVETKALRDTEGALLKVRKEASSIRDAISSEEMSKSGSSDAAQALSQVTGASVQEGKYVLIRGLGERYVTTQLNGSALPSADPDKKSVQMDLFPAKLLDNVTAIKTFTPDKPGDFTGGIINMETKSLPEKFSANFSSSRGYNSNSTSSPYFLTYAGGDRDWMGMDDGTRQLPGELGDPEVDIPTASQAYRNADRAHELDRLSKSFNTVMSPSTKTAPANSSYSLSVGTRSEVLGKPLGILGSFSYNRSFTAYNDGIAARYTLTGNVSEVNQLNRESFLNDSRASDEVVWGGLVNLAYNLSPGHELGVNYMYNRSGTSTARYLYGPINNLSAEDTYETRVLQYT